jgi:hypothetical protein
MRNMSFALTSDQVLAQTKDVTRRDGWLDLKPWALLQPVRKGMGLRAGEKVEKLGSPIRVLFVHREPLRAIDVDENGWGIGWTETRREGFPNMRPADFVTFFCGTHKGCTPDRVISRIEFSYDLLEGWCPMDSAPRDGTHVELLVRHHSWHYARPHEKAMWQSPHRGHWIDFNGGGWTWEPGLCGSPIAWRLPV